MSIPSGSVSKLKSQLRQTKRLLARDDLTPDLRLTTTRRDALLEAELAKASAAFNTSVLEKKMVTKYRGIRFFERQKLLRKIKQTKKALLDTPDDHQLVNTLSEARVDLYYVVHFPKTAKYQSLFPSGSYIPLSPDSSSSTSTDVRSTFRLTIQRKMKEGTISQDVETSDLGIQGEEDVGVGSSEGASEPTIVAAPVNAVAAVPSTHKRERVIDDSRPKPAKRSRGTDEPTPRPVVQVEETAIVPEPVPVAPESTIVLDPVAAAKKAKKDLKDKKRREKKRAEEAASGVKLEPDASEPAKSVKELPAVVEKLKKDDKAAGGKWKQQKNASAVLIHDALKKKETRKGAAFDDDEFFA